MKFKPAYITDPDFLQPAIDKGVIDEGDLIIVDIDDKGSFRFIREDGSLLEFPAAVDQQQLEDAVKAAVAEASAKISWEPFE